MRYVFTTQFGSISFDGDRHQSVSNRQDAHSSRAERHVYTYSILPTGIVWTRLFKSASRSTRICHSARAELHVPTYSILPSGIVWMRLFKSASRSTRICHSARAERHVTTYSKLPGGTADHSRSA